MQTLIVDDHSLFGDGLRLLLLQAEVCDEAVCCTSGDEALERMRVEDFDLVLLDWNLGDGPSGVALIAELKAVRPHARVVIVSGDASSRLVRAAIDAGAVGFVAKESTPALLVDALSTTAHGGIYLPRSVLVDDAASGGSPVTLTTVPQRLRALDDAFPHLTPRHRDVLGYLVRGMSNKEIARQLDITDGTVKQHLNVIFRELGVHNRTEAVYLLAKQGIRFE